MKGTCQTEQIPRFKKIRPIAIPYLTDEPDILFKAIEVNAQGPGTRTTHFLGPKATCNFSLSHRRKKEKLEDSPVVLKHAGMGKLGLRASSVPYQLCELGQALHLAELCLGNGGDGGLSEASLGGLKGRLGGST